jgi:hypothetical protein
LLSATLSNPQFLTQPPLDFLDWHFLRQVLWHPIAHPRDGDSHFPADRSVGVDRRLLAVDSFPLDLRVGGCR